MSDADDTKAHQIEDGIDPTRLLSPRELAFCREYLVDGNAIRAAIRVGYAPNTGAAKIHQPHIVATIQRFKAMREAPVDVVDQVLTETALLAHSSLENYYIDDEGYVRPTEFAPEGAMRAIASMKRRKTVKESKDGSITINYDVEIKLWDKPGPLKLRGRHVNLFPNRVEVTGKDGTPLTLTGLSDEQLKQRALDLAGEVDKLKDGE